MRINFTKHGILPQISLPQADGYKSTPKAGRANGGNQNALMDNLSIMKNYNMPFLGKTNARPVYAIDRQMKETWFPSANKAGKTLSVPVPSILKCLAEDETKRAKYAGEYCFTLASNVEIIKEDGTVDIDREKIKQIFETAEVARVEGANVKKRRFYGMNEEHKPIPFLSYAEAEEVTSAVRPNIIRCLKGDIKTTGGYIFFNPEEIEIAGEGGKVDYDEEKLAALIKRADVCLANSRAAEKIPLYAMYIGNEEDKPDIRFDTIREATSALKISYESISACLSGDSDFAGDYCFAHAASIETIKEDGTIEINEAKIDELKKKAKIAKENNNNLRGKAIFSLKIENDTLDRYDKSSDASNALTIGLANISACLAGRKKSTGGYIFLPAYKIEVKDENGVLKPDKEKLKIALKELDESVAAYKAQKAAKKAAQKPKDEKPKDEKPKAKEQKENKPKVQKPKIEKPKIEKPKTPPIKAQKPENNVSSKVSEVVSDTLIQAQVSDTPSCAAVKNDKNMKNRETLPKAAAAMPEKIKQASYEPAAMPVDILTLNIAPEEIAPVPEPEQAPALTAEQETEQSLSKNPETIEMKNTPDKINKETAKVPKETKTAKTPKAKDPQALRKKYMKLGKIYAYKRGGDCIEYKDLFVASEKLETDPATLYRIIKSNLSINGLVFTTDADYK